MQNLSLVVAAKSFRRRWEIKGAIRRFGRGSNARVALRLKGTRGQVKRGARSIRALFLSGRAVDRGGGFERRLDYNRAIYEAVGVVDSG